MEISQKIIVNNCYTGVKNARQACLYYQYQDDASFKMFYVVFGENKDLVIVAKIENNLKVYFKPTLILALSDEIFTF